MIEPLPFVEAYVVTWTGPSGGRGYRYYARAFYALRKARQVRELGMRDVAVYRTDTRWEPVP